MVDLAIGLGIPFLQMALRKSHSFYLHFQGAEGDVQNSLSKVTDTTSGKISAAIPQRSTRQRHTLSALSGRPSLA